MEKKYIALTFDDGPNATTTVTMLDILEEHGVKASFFLWGDFITEETEPVVRRTFESGHEICNHSKTHTPFDQLTPEQMLAEIEWTENRIKSIIGKGTKFFRPPYIGVNDSVYETVPLPMICGIAANDWVPEVTAQQRFDMIMEAVKPGAIILLHDLFGNDQTLDAVEMLIPALRAEGYEFVTVSELFEKYGIDPCENKYLYTFADQTVRRVDE